jgi:signal transduction histidine kinase
MSSKWGESFRHALALRLGIWYAAIFVVSASALTLFAYLLLARALEVRDHQVIETLLTRYAAGYQRAGLPGLMRLLREDAGEGRHEQMMIRVLNAGTTELAYYSEPDDWTTPWDSSQLDQPAAKRSGWLRIARTPDTVLEVGTLNLDEDVAIQVGRSSRVRSELLEYFRQRAFQFGGLVALIAIAGGVLITYAGLAPLRSLEATVRSIVATGRFDARVAVTAGRDPLDTLGGQINIMLERIQSLLGGMRGALDNVAHDLRTPLTRFRNVAEHALVSNDPAAMREGLGHALEEADRVNATLNALIDISEAETGTMRLTAEPLELKTVVEEAVELYADEAEEKGLVLETSIPPDLTLVGDRTRLRQVLANLIENAVKYTDRGGRIDVDAVTDDDWVRVRVRDTGIGISESDAPLVWDRLYRADASRSARGLGLGLSLVKAIVEAHGGRVELRSTPGEGSTFTVLLPARWSGRTTMAPRDDISATR